MYMQNSFRNKIRKNAMVIAPVIGIITIILMISLVWYWETSGRELYFYNEIIVLNSEVNKGTIITNELLSTKRLKMIA